MPLTVALFANTSAPVLFAAPVNDRLLKVLAPDGKFRVVAFVTVKLYRVIADADKIELVPVPDIVIVDVPALTVALAPTVSTGETPVKFTVARFRFNVDVPASEIAPLPQFKTDRPHVRMAALVSVKSLPLAVLVTVWPFVSIVPNA